MPKEINSKETFWTTGRIIVTAVVVVLAATIVYTLLSGHSEDESKIRVVLPGTPISDTSKVAPTDFEIATIDGSAFKLSDYRGKVVVLDFWATWCPPCIESVPQLVRIAKESQQRGVEIIGLHIDDRGRSKPEDIRKFINRYNINYTIGLATDDMFTSYLGFEETTIPQTLVFDRNGKAVAHLVGYNRNLAQELDAAVNKALAGS
jgi:thiol-disulfide isomerase/thioredoxin